MTDKSNNNTAAEQPKQDKPTTATTPTPAKEAPKKATKEQPKAPAKTEKSEKKSGSKTGLIAIALVIALGGGLYYHGHQQGLQQQQRIEALQQQIASMKAAMQNDQKETITLINGGLRSAEVSLSQQQKSIAALQTTVTELKGNSPNDWLLAEADYLVKMAGRKLWLEHDVTSATLLLESADHRIAEMNDPSLKNLRQAMSNDITTLKSLTHVDRDGIVLRLTSLENSVDNLPLANAILPKAVDEPQSQTVSQSVNDWKDNLLTSLKNFGEHFITYRKRDGNVVPLLSPQQDFYLQQNIKNKLEVAIDAVYREQGDVYKISLDTAKKWAEQYYDMSSPLTQSFIKSLDQLAQQQITVNYPEKLQSQALITKLVNQVLRNKMATLDDAQAQPVKQTKPAVKPTPETEAPAVEKKPAQAKLETTVTQPAETSIKGKNNATVTYNTVTTVEAK
ncbi:MULTISPECIES: uroporphyrinogen-III C-methyltransferase [unclassified Photobacterium]|uniref:uroporphyrinogen-III C-methyltransferase n=1 Tax=unclassified Photobacterium TaxID=2628852 RepID=UPI000D16A45D|nr:MULTISPECIES: uroporphyrinogen-III C-methyltransferase [unclassified Photobacterium]PSV24825.1 uroporphyrinogen-III C-methyltransferase [Photobacterium sp. GB-56]PSV35257.1 uroporphyrinogen-III C-methyltransferase [Photobacterium sp. GB-27]PSV51578.1 uroporphyrinogen-III C-methyltransferase [Photobacterium sp. GB-1]